MPQKCEMFQIFLLVQLCVLSQIFQAPQVFCKKTSRPSTPLPTSWSEHNNLQNTHESALFDQYQDLPPVPVVTYHPPPVPLALALESPETTPTPHVPLSSSGLSATLNKILKNYDKRVRPDFYGPPKNVSITINVKSLAAVSEVDMEFDIDFYLRQYWQDER
ncbi:unnamed protein product, partial [Allacma fusca]